MHGDCGMRDDCRVIDWDFYLVEKRWCVETGDREGWCGTGDG